MMAIGQSLCRLIGMQPTTYLPEPWEEVAPYSKQDRDRLERIIGSQVSVPDLTVGKDIVVEDGFSFPLSERARWAVKHRWVNLRNSETGERVTLRLQRDANDNITITSVIVPFKRGEQITGASLRSIPLAAIAVAYTASEKQTSLEVLRWNALEGNIPDPLDPLPSTADRSPRFLSLVARQYEALEDGEGSPIAKMASLNNRPYSTVGRWVSQARKDGFLLPTTRGR